MVILAGTLRPIGPVPGVPKCPESWAIKVLGYPFGLGGGPLASPPIYMGVLVYPETEEWGGT